MEREYERRNLSFPKGLPDDVRAVLKPTETLSGVVSQYLIDFVYRRRFRRKK